MLALRHGVRQIRAFSSAASGMPQLDNSSEFLPKGPHRKHPGLLHLNIVRLPQEAVEAVRFILKQNPVQHLEEHAASLNNYLWSRKRPAEDADLRAKAIELEAELRTRKNSVGRQSVIAWVQQPLPLTTMAVTRALQLKQNALAGSRVKQEKLTKDVAVTEQEGKIKNQVLIALRKHTYHWQPLSYTSHIGLVYLAARFAGGFAAVTRALKEISHRVPDFKPQTLLDFGSGVGTVTWAAHAFWGNSLKEYICVDGSASMNNLSELIMKGGVESGDMHIRGIYFRQYLPVSPKVQHDLVISAFSLNELPNFAAREKTIQALWRKTGGFLVLVENGTREGHQLLMEARDIVLQGGDKEIWDDRPACVFAPCPHEMQCPKLAEKAKLPCNFVQQYQSLPLNWNPPERWEKFSFLIFSRGIVASNDSNWPRVIGPVLRRPRHVHCHTCASDGKLHHDVLTPRRHGKDLYRCARNCEWGDRLPAVISDSASDLEESNKEETRDS